VQRSRAFIRTDFVTRLAAFLALGSVAAAVTCTLPSTAAANGIRVDSTRVSRTPSGEIVVTARVTWANAWRNARNHDAAWLFVKYRRGPMAGWGHAKITGVTATGATPSLACQATADRVGAFCAPAGAYRGNVTANLRLEIDGSSMPPGARNAATLEAQMFGIEMVYVPAGPFTVGDPDPASASQAAFYRSDAAGAHAGPMRIASEAAIDVAPRTGALYYQSPSEYTGDRLGPIPAEFPKGTRAFFAMKYEVLQGQYAAFLTAVSPEVASFRANNAGPGYREHRGTIRLAGARYMAERPERPANMLSWDDGIAFADWAGLRPMTEFEFTKAARGPVDPVPGDYPWGTNSKARLLRRLSADLDLMQTGDADESRLSDETKEVFGASYWWVMDLAGSVWEKVVTLGHPRGRAFRGTHGDGTLRGYGLATNDDWPAGDHDGGGYGYRGGGFYEWDRERVRNPNEVALNPHSPVSWRPYGSWGGAPRSVAYGFRAVRTADGDDAIPRE
jgi:formylglycine-generating enzyme required for sulfatase activity